MTDTQQYRKDQVVTIINSVIRKIEAAETFSRESVYKELRGLHELVEELKSEISTKPEEIRSEHIPSATDELDAIITSTAEATGTIMDSCEAIEELVASCDEAIRDKVIENITGIYEACSFQDITGQRITKVVNTLKIIDEKVEKILEAFGSEDFAHVSESAEDEPQSLLNGPQLPDKAVSQEDIDKLLAEFD